MLDTGSGSWILEAGDWKPETGSWRLEAGDWKLDTGSRRLEAGSSMLSDVEFHDS